MASGTTLSDDTGPAHFGYGGQWGGQTESLSYRYTLFSYRWYDPAYGRWLTRDPIGYGGGMNLYAYANGDPVNNIDPNGTDVGWARGGGGNDSYWNGGAPTDPFDPNIAAMVVAGGPHNLAYDSSPMDPVYREASHEIQNMAGILSAGGGGTGESKTLICPEPEEAAQTTALPQMVYDYNVTPELADNIWHAQKAGRPSILTWGGNANLNRAAAMMDGTGGKIPSFPGLSRDEYPFASSMEGGAGAWVGPVPVGQQRWQGGMISNFGRVNKMQPGDRYEVIVTNHPGDQ